jgi:hypothetical protein
MYIRFAVFNTAIIPCVWIFFSETSKRSLEKIVLAGRNNGLPSPSSHLYFAKAHSEGVSPVKMAREMPRYHSTELDRELKYFEVDDVESARRRSSVRRQSSAAAASRSRDVGVQKGVRFWVLQESQDYIEERKVPWSQNDLVCDCGGCLEVLIR